MKKTLTILLFSFGIIWVVSFFLLKSSLYMPELNKARIVPIPNNNDTLYGKTTTLPDYIPPPDGGYNQKWNCNRNYYLNPERQCCFGKGMRYRHRYGQQK